MFYRKQLQFHFQTKNPKTACSWLVSQLKWLWIQWLSYKKWWCQMGSSDEISEDIYESLSEVPFWSSSEFPSYIHCHTASRRWKLELECDNYCGLTETVYPHYTSPQEFDFMMTVLSDVQFEDDRAALQNRPKSITYDCTSTLQYNKLPVMAVNFQCVYPWLGLWSNVFVCFRFCFTSTPNLRGETRIVFGDLVELPPTAMTGPGEIPTLETTKQMFCQLDKIVERCGLSWKEFVSAQAVIKHVC